MSAIRLALLLVIGAALGAASLPAQSGSSPGARVRAAAREYRERNEGAILTEYAGLLAIPNLASDSVNIWRNAHHLVRMLGARGFRNAQMLSVPGSAPSVYAELPAPGATRTLVLYAHFDGQPVDPQEWANPPWSPTLRDRALSAGGNVIPIPAGDGRVDGEARIYARSASDDKASIMAILAAIDALRAGGIAPSVNLKVFLEGEEEMGSGHLHAILEKYATLLAADGWIFGDGPVHQSGRQQVIFGVRGVTDFELTLYGPLRALHSGHYGNWAPNPGVLLANLVASMRTSDGRILIPGYYSDVRPISAAERHAIAAIPHPDTTLRRTLALGRTEANNALLAERIMYPALNLRGMKVGGVRETGANAIPTEAYASFDLRLVPNQTPERVRGLVEAHIRRQGYFVTNDSVTEDLRRAHPRVARVEWGTAGGYRASRAPMDGPFGRAVLAALSDGASERPLAIPTFGGSLPIYTFEEVLKTPLITLPIANADNNQHAANENLRVQNLWDGIETYAALLAAIGQSWGERPIP